MEKHHGYHIPISYNNNNNLIIIISLISFLDPTKIISITESIAPAGSTCVGLARSQHRPRAPADLPKKNSHQAPWLSKISQIRIRSVPSGYVKIAIENGP